MKEKLHGKLILTTYLPDPKRADRYKIACFIANGQLEYMKVLPEEHSFPIGSIVTGKVTNVVSNIPAAFVALDSKKTMGFLSLDHIEQTIVTNRTFDGKLRSGDEVLVKVIREPIKTKEATLSAVLDMTSKYAVAQNGTGRLLFSKKLSAFQKEQILTYLVSKALATREKQLIGMEDIDLTIRTEAASLVKAGDFSSLNRDISYVVTALRSMRQQACMRTCYFVHQKPVTWITEVWEELSAMQCMIEEYVTDDFLLLTQLQQILPKEQAEQIRFYDDTSVSLSTLYQIPSHMDRITQKNVWLPCGGYLCIEPTEAMTVIDVNTGKAIQKKETEQLFYMVNQEAAAEIARQIRLRNISGMVLIDFINMKDKAMEEQIKEEMKRHTKKDFCQTHIYEFTQLGLLEMTRSKKSRALHEHFGRERNR